MQIELKCSITRLPSDVTGYNLIPYTEGDLDIRINRDSVLTVSGVLVVEMAVALFQWLSTCADVPTSFYYASMDFEEEPLLEYFYDSDRESYQVRSVFAEAVIASGLSGDELRRASESYLCELSKSLSSSVELLRMLREVVDMENSSTGRHKKNTGEM